MFDPESVLTPGQAGSRLAVTSERVRQLIQAGKLAATKTPLGYLVDRADVERLVEARRRAGNTHQL